MPNSQTELLTLIAEFDPEVQEWTELDDLVAQLCAPELTPVAIRAIFGIYERFPEEEDGYGLFWSFLHRIEKVPGYEGALIESVLRKPSEFALTMVNRILNGGHTHIGTIDLLALLRDVSAGPHVSAYLRECAADFVAYQQEKAAAP